MSTSSGYVMDAAEQDPGNTTCAVLTGNPTENQRLPAVLQKTSSLLCAAGPEAASPLRLPPLPAQHWAPRGRPGGLRVPPPEHRHHQAGPRGGPSADGAFSHPRPRAGPGAGPRARPRARPRSARPPPHAPPALTFPRRGAGRSDWPARPNPLRGEAGT